MYSKQYAHNWHLIADVFNASTSRLPTDMRIAWDVYDRWNKKYGPASQSTQLTTPSTGASSAPSEPQVSTSGSSSAKAQPVKKSPPRLDGASKKVVHKQAIGDAIVKMQRRREQQARTQGGVH